MNQFNELSLPQSVHINLKRNCFIGLTPVQEQALPPAMAGTDVVATAQTGTGKTLAFLLPIIVKLLKPPTPALNDVVRGLVLSPTRELAIQIAETFAKLSINTGLRAAVE